MGVRSYFAIFAGIVILALSAGGAVFFDSLKELSAAQVPAALPLLICALAGLAFTTRQRSA